MQCDKHLVTKRPDGKNVNRMTCYHNNLRHFGVVQKSVNKVLTHLFKPLTTNSEQN